MGNNHSHATTTKDRNLVIGLVLNTGFTIAEFIIGFASGSLALVSDAAHNLTDSLSILITISATKFAKRKATTIKTYGYGRTTVLAAFLNAVILLCLSLYIFYEAFQRIQNPEPVSGGWVMITAFAGLLINGAIALLFYKNKSDLNIRSTFLNMALDALASAGALLAGFIIVLTGKTFIDPLISIFIGLMLLYGGWSVIKDALHILLDGVPEGLSAEKVKSAINEVPGVQGLDDLHIWALSTTTAALSCHLVISDADIGTLMATKERVKHMLQEKFNIEHATLEVELTAGPHHNERIDEGV